MSDIPMPDTPAIHVEDVDAPAEVGRDEQQVGRDDWEWNYGASRSANVVDEVEEDIKSSKDVDEAREAATETTETAETTVAQASTPLPTASDSFTSHFSSSTSSSEDNDEPENSPQLTQEEFDNAFADFDQVSPTRAEEVEAEQHEAENEAAYMEYYNSDPDPEPLDQSYLAGPHYQTEAERFYASRAARRDSHALSFDGALMPMAAYGDDIVPRTASFVSSGRPSRPSSPTPKHVRGLSSGFSVEASENRTVERIRHEREVMRSARDLAQEERETARRQRDEMAIELREAREECYQWGVKLENSRRMIAQNVEEAKAYKTAFEKNLPCARVEIARREARAMGIDGMVDVGVQTNRVVSVGVGGLVGGGVQTNDEGTQTKALPDLPLGLPADICPMLAERIVLWLGYRADDNADLPNVGDVAKLLSNSHTTFIDIVLALQEDGLTFAEADLAKEMETCLAPHISVPAAIRLAAHPGHQSLNDILKDLVRASSTHSTEKAKMKDSVRDVVKKFDDLSKQYTELQQNFAEQASELAKAQRELLSQKESEDLATKLDQLIEHGRHLKAECDRLESELANAQKQNAELLKQLQTARAESQETSELLRVSEENVVELTAEKSALKQTCERFRQQLPVVGDDRRRTMDVSTDVREQSPRPAPVSSPTMTSRSQRTVSRRKDKSPHPAAAPTPEARPVISLSVSLTPGDLLKLLLQFLLLSVVLSLI